MGFNKQNYIRIKREYEGKSLASQEKANARRNELALKIPRIAEIDAELSRTGMKIFEASTVLRGEALEARINELKEQNLKLNAERKAVLEYHGYPADYSDVKYECNECSDTGFVGIKMCRCMKQSLIMAGYESSGIGKLIRSKSFDNFDISYQKGDKTAYENASMIYGFCKSYAENFDERSQNLLFIGGTGLGKTHLCAAITGKVIENGFDAVCETAQNIFSDFETEHFRNPYGKDENITSKTERYIECDLLVIDDLGTELTNQFTVSCLYNVINTRLNRGKPMIINTNLTRDELKNRYSDRITSRLFGEFLPIIFIGRDIRELKLD